MKKHNIHVALKDPLSQLYMTEVPQATEINYNSLSYNSLIEYAFEGSEHIPVISVSSTHGEILKTIDYIKKVPLAKTYEVLESALNSINKISLRVKQNFPLTEEERSTMANDILTVTCIYFVVKKKPIPIVGVKYR